MSESSRKMAVSRRGFFPLLLREIAVTVKSAQGTPAHALTDLCDLPDEELAAICPMINPACRIRVVEGQVCSQFTRPEDAPLRQHFPTTPENLAVFNRINGRQTLAEIAQSVAEQLDWEPDRAWTHTRGLFEILARQLAAVPKNSPELDAEHAAHNAHETDAPESGI